MTEIANNVDGAKVPAQQPELISVIFRCYRDNFVIFWRIMLPFVVLGFLFHFGESLLESRFDSVSDPKNLWRFDTTRGLAVSEYPREDPVLSGSVDSGMTFSFHALSIGFLWLAICPLTFVIVRYYRGAEVTMRRVWQRTRPKIGAILRGFVLLYALAVLGLFAFVVLTSAIFPMPAAPNASSLCLGLFLISVVLIYFGVNWSLYNQIIIIEDQRLAIEAMRRSSTLVRSVWGRTFGVYLFLALVTMVFTSVVLGLTLLVYSLTVPEFAPIQKVLLSPEFFTLFFGGYARISFESVPNLWTAGVIVIVNTLVHAVLAPVWAIVTTHLYLDRTGESEVVSE
jgi:hypothetical protein